MSIYDYEEAFGAWDKTSRAMRSALKEWSKLYYGTDSGPEEDPCQRVAYTVVSKLIKTVFGEYKASSRDPFVMAVIEAMEPRARTAMELALVGGSCFLKPCPGKTGFTFALIPRENVLVFGRDGLGRITDMGTMERSVRGRYYYTLLERRRVDEQGLLTIENRLFRSLNVDNLGSRADLKEHPEYALLAESYRYQTPVGGVGLVELKMPILNCVDGSADGVSIYAPAVGLIRSIDSNEAQLKGEFIRGQSRIIASQDLLKDGQQLQDHLFVGLDEDPERVGITVFSPTLRHTAYLERKQEYLRNVESIIGLKRGMLSDTNAEDRTATEITSSAGDYNLTVIGLQKAWEEALGQGVRLCGELARIYKLGQPAEQAELSVDWGNGVLYDEDKTWESYRQMVSDGLLKPEIALGWRFNMRAETEEDLEQVRKRYMPVREAP